MKIFGRLIGSRRCFWISLFSLSLGVAISLGWAAPSPRSEVSLAGGLRVKSVRHPLGAVQPQPSRPPLQGPLFGIALKVTDERAVDDLDWVARPYWGVTGQALPGSTLDWQVAVLDSGAGTHLLSYPDAQGFGVMGEEVTDSEFPVGGIGGMLTIEVSQPLGFFVHGIQDVTAEGAVQPGMMAGQGNFAAGVNTLENHEEGHNLPTVVGTPFFAYYTVLFENSKPVEVELRGHKQKTASVTLYDNPYDPDLPKLDHRLQLALQPTPQSMDVAYSGLPNMEDFSFEPWIPSVLGLGSLYFTSALVQFQELDATVSGRLMVDTAAEATIISVMAANNIGLDLQNPSFEVDIQGIAGTVTAPGFYVDEVRIPTHEATLVWKDVPVVVLDVPSPEGNNMFGILGTNLLADRDILFNGQAQPPYMEISEPILKSNLQITAMRQVGEDVLEFDWLAQPAPQLLVLEATEDFMDPSGWTAISTGELATVTGTMSVTGVHERQFFRLVAPEPEEDEPTGE